jgi:hypothetical protein|tara:strand:+ start:7352 stop:7684 length:333 start_codon:yes stop_codon:yes gene_type:complete
LSTNNASVANWQAYVDSCGNDDFEPLGTDDIDIAIEYLLSNAIAVSHPAEFIALLKYARLCKGIIVEIGTCAAGNTCILGLSHLLFRGRDNVYTPHSVALFFIKVLQKCD